MSISFTQKQANSLSIKLLVLLLLFTICKFKFHDFLKFSSSFSPNTFPSHQYLLTPKLRPSPILDT